MLARSRKVLSVGSALYISPPLVDIPKSPSMEGDGDAGGFARPKTAQEEKAAAERSKREAEMAELRRLRAEQAAQSGSSSMTAAEAARKKREEELEAMRKNKSAENEEFRRKLSEKGGTLTTDMDAWRHNQMGAKEADRLKKLEAQSNLGGYKGYVGTKSRAELDKEAAAQARQDAAKNLHGYHGYVGTKTKAELEHDKQHQAQVESAHAMANMNLGEENGEEKAEAKEEAPKVEEMKKELEKKPSRGVMFKEAPAEEIPPAKKSDKLHVSFNAGDQQAPSQEAKAFQPKRPSLEDAYARADSDENAGAMTLNAPTYSRVDIKFSFGLIVRSSAADGFNENLRDNETLKKCMDGTSKILREEMPEKPDISKMQTTLISFKIKFPEAYYDPSLEPTVISIEEDKKEGQKKTAKGNKRTLVKASFPVFLRDEALDEEGEKRSQRILKETKTTVFKALRAAVSGGSFLS